MGKRMQVFANFTDAEMLCKATAALRRQGFAKDDISVTSQRDGETFEEARSYSSEVLIGIITGIAAVVGGITGWFLTVENLGASGSWQAWWGATLGGIIAGALAGFLATKAINAGCAWQEEDLADEGAHLSVKCMDTPHLEQARIILSENGGSKVGASGEQGVSEFNQEIPAEQELPMERQAASGRASTQPEPLPQPTLDSEQLTKGKVTPL